MKKFLYIFGISFFSFLTVVVSDGKDAFSFQGLTLENTDMNRTPKEPEIQDLRSESAQYQTPSMDDRIYLDIIGRWPYGGSFTVATNESGDLAAISAGGGIFILDVSNPASVIEKSRIGSTYMVKDLSFKNNFLFVANDNNGLRVFDVSDPSNPIEASYKNGDFSVVVVEDSLAYCQNYDLFLDVIDVSDPYNLNILGFWIGNAVDIAVSDTLVFVANINDGVIILDASDPSNIHTISQITKLLYTTAVAAEGPWLYIADDNQKVLIADVSNPSNPSIVSETIYPATYISDLYYKDSYLYIANKADGFKILDVSNPYRPIKNGSLASPGTTLEIDMFGSLAFTANLTAGMRIIDVNNPGYPEEKGYFNTPGYLNKIVLQDNFIYVLESNRGFRILDISNPRDPEVVGIYDFPHDPFTNSLKGFDVSGSYVYITDGYGLSVVDASDFSSIEEVGRVETAGESQDIRVGGSYAYIADGDSGFAVIDVADPVNPHEVARISLPGESTGLDMEDTLVGVMAKCRIYFFDVSDPTNPERVGPSINANYSYDLVISDDYLYYVDIYYGLIIYDISDIESPQKVGVYYSMMLNSSAFSVKDNYVFIGGSHSIDVIDVTDKSHPRNVAFCFTPNSISSTVADSSNIYATAGYYGMIVVTHESQGVDSGNTPSADIPSVSRLSPNRPNPFNPVTTIDYTTAEDGRVALAIYDLSGRLVRQLFNDFQSAGNHSISWNGTDEKGKCVSSGVYIYRLETKNFSESRKMILLK